MLTQIFIGAALIMTTVIIHAVSLELIMKAFFAVNTELEARFRAITFALVVTGVFIAHIIEI